MPRSIAAAESEARAGRDRLPLRRARPADRRGHRPRPTPRLPAHGGRTGPRAQHERARASTTDAYRPSVLARLTTCRASRSRSPSSRPGADTRSTALRHRCCPRPAPGLGRAGGAGRAGPGAPRGRRRHRDHRHVDLEPSHQRFRRRQRAQPRRDRGSTSSRPPRTSPVPPRRWLPTRSRASVPDPAKAVRSRRGTTSRSGSASKWATGSRERGTCSTAGSTSAYASPFNLPAPAVVR